MRLDNSQLLLVLAVVTSPVTFMSAPRAQHMNAADAPCRASGGTDGAAGFAACLTAAAQEAEAELKNAYRRVMAVLEPADRQALQDVQRGWLSYRDQACIAERNLYGGGTGGIAAQPACRAALTRHRIADLKGTYGWKMEKFGG